MMKRVVTPFLTIAVVGVLLVASAVWIQSIAMDLDRYSLAEYLSRDVASFAWWGAIGVPIVLGAAYVVTSVLAIRANLDLSQA
jgi:hypothetical protein